MTSPMNYQTFKELTSILLKLYPKTEEEGTLLNTFYEDSIALIPKSDEAITRKLYINTLCEHQCKILNTLSAN